MRRLQAMIAKGRLKAEQQLDQKRRANVPLPNMVQHGQCAGFVVQTVCGHQENAGGFRGGDHRLGLCHRSGERLFHHDMLARLRGAKGVIGMQGIGQSDINGVHRIAGQQCVVIGIADHLGDVVKGRQFSALGHIAGHNGGDGGIAALADTGQERLLGKTARTDDCVTYHPDILSHKAQGAPGMSA
jgi:hypothetical protein